jgi:hypothetical protein
MDHEIAIFVARVHVYIDAIIAELNHVQQHLDALEQLYFDNGGGLATVLVNERKRLLGELAMSGNTKVQQQHGHEADDCQRDVGDIESGEIPGTAKSSGQEHICPPQSYSAQDGDSANLDPRLFVTNALAGQCLAVQRFLYSRRLAYTLRELRGTTTQAREWLESVKASMSTTSRAIGDVSATVGDGDITAEQRVRRGERPEILVDSQLLDVMFRSVAEEFIKAYKGLLVPDTKVE